MSVVDYQGVNARRGLSQCFLGDLIVNIEILNWPDQAWIANILVFVSNVSSLICSCRTRVKWNVKAIVKEAGVTQLCDSVIVWHSCVPVRHVGDYVRAGDMGAIMGKQRERTGDKNQAITWQGKAITWKGKEIRWPGKAKTWQSKAITWQGKAIIWQAKCQPGLLRSSFLCTGS